jgi:DNA-binding NtrC family response regulator
MNPQALTLTWTTDAMRQLKEEMDLASHTDASVLLTGETGVGKRFAAHAIHQLSERGRAPFIAINTAQVLTTALTSSGAADPFASEFLRAAEGGTLLIQDIEHIPADVQSQLAGVLDRRTTATKQVRLMSTTTVDLFALVQAGDFREDLFYRLNVIALNIPPLRERREDIPLMFRHYLTLHAGIDAPGLSTAAQRRVMEYPWPGNITELTSVTKTLSSRNLPELIDLEHLPCPLVGCQSRDKEPRHQ